MSTISRGFDPFTFLLSLPGQRKNGLWVCYSTSSFPLLLINSYIKGFQMVFSRPLNIMWRFTRVLMMRKWTHGNLIACVQGQQLASLLLPQLCNFFCNLFYVLHFCMGFCRNQGFTGSKSHAMFEESKSIFMCGRKILGIICSAV